MQTLYLGTFRKLSGNRNSKLIGSKSVHEIIPHPTSHTKNNGFHRDVDVEVIAPLIDRMERELNCGLLGNEADRAYPRVGQHNREIFFVRLLREPDGNRIF